MTIDGRASEAFDDPGAPLSYAWKFEEDEARTDGALDEPLLVVTFRGDRPPRIVLTVTTPDGSEGTVSERLRLTVP